MYICSVLLYRCSLSVYSPFSSHCWCAFGCVFDACVCGEVGLKAMCLVRILTRTVWVLTNHNRQSNVQNVPCESQTCHIIIDTRHNNYPKVAVLVSLGLCEINAISCSRVGTNSSVGASIQKKRTISRIPRIRSRGTGSTFDISQHEPRVSPRKPSQYQKRLFAVNVHCKKTTTTIFFTCILYFAPLSFYSCAELPL